MTTLRPYQVDAVAGLEEVTAAHRRAILVAPTGSGKTVIASEVIKRAAEQYKRVLFLAHRREIILQTSAKLTAHGVRHGVIMAGVDPRPMEAVQVASIDTLLVRGVRSKAMELPPADLIVFDEAHRSRGRTREHLISLYPDATLLGMTATPCRGDGRGLGNMFDTMVETPQVRELIDQGCLVPSRVYAPVDPDLRGVRTEKGDYVINQLATRMNTDALVGDIVEQWLKHGEGRRTVAFAVDIAHSVHIAREFVNAGVRAEHLDGSTPIAEREAILARLDPSRHELHGADGRLGHAGSRMLRSRSSDQADGPLPADDRSGAAAGGRQARCDYPRPQRRRISARPAGGPRRVDAQDRPARTESDSRRSQSWCFARGMPELPNDPVRSAALSALRLDAETSRARCRLRRW
jgi:Type III restriction enzyme, res subunit